MNTIKRITWNTEKQGQYEVRNETGAIIAHISGTSRWWTVTRAQQAEGESGRHYSYIMDAKFYARRMSRTISFDVAERENSMTEADFLRQIVVSDRNFRGA